jgi:carbonic anhydrase
LDELLAGYRRFRAEQWPRERSRFETTAREGQKPRALVLACSDSRVDPQMILGARPGELFVVRNIANLAPPYQPDAAYHGTSAALEFGVRVLKVEHLIVMGHGMCGGVRALLDGAPPETRDFMANWIEIAEPARRAAERASTPEARYRASEEETVKVTLANLMTFPWVAEAVEAGWMKLHGAYFDIRYGTLYLLQPDGRFEPAPEL